MLAASLRCSPALVLIETPSNPLMRIVDIRAIALRAHASGAKVAVDNTFLSPALQQPIALGADFVIHSTTKYINGHSDVVGGAVVAADKRDYETLASWANIWRDGRAIRFLPDATRIAHLVSADSPATIKRRHSGEFPSSAPRSERRPLSRSALASGARNRQDPTMWLRRNVEL